MDIKDILFINYEICQSKSQVNNDLLALSRDALVKYYKVIKEINKDNDHNEKQRALRRINNHIFNIMYELIANLNFELFNSCFRLARSIVEDKALLQFIYQSNEKQAYWYNKWHYIQLINNYEKEEYDEVFKDQKEEDYAKYLNQSFIATHEKIFGLDYGYAQESLGNQYVTMKDIMSKVDPSKQSYAIFKLFSDLSHGSNQRTNKFDYLVRHDLDFNENTETGIYILIDDVLKLVAKYMPFFNIEDEKYINDFKTSVDQITKYIKDNDVVNNKKFKDYVSSIEIPDFD